MKIYKIAMSNSEEARKNGIYRMQKLILEATKTCQWRGHRLGKWEYDIKGHKARASNECVKCGNYVVVDTHPAPNGIDIAGDALALTCKEIKDEDI